MFEKIEHIGIAVKDIEKSKELFSKLFTTPCYKEEIVESEKVKTAFFKIGLNKIELLGATASQSVIQTYLEKKGEGFHHVAFAVDNIKQEIERLKKLGFVFISEEPKKGADNKLIVFLHPKSTNGILVELCQEII